MEISTFRLRQFLLLFFLLPLSFSRRVVDFRVLRGSWHSARFNPSNSKQILSHPRVFSYEGLLSDYECDHLISLANVDNYARTGTRISLNPGHDKIVSKIEERISLWTLIPIEHGSGIQIQHYNTNQSNYETNESNFIHGENIFATILISLSDVKNGGETIFPNPKEKSKPKCGSSDFAIKPQKGNAIIFFNLNLDATKDNTSIHEECPVLQGAKWSAIKYIHVRPLEPTLNKDDELSVKLDKEDCTDEDVNCEDWAKKGECEKNPVFMVGTPDYYGTCRKSCGACENLF